MSLAALQQSAHAESRLLAGKIPLPAEEVHIWSFNLRVRRAAMCACWDLLSREEMRTALRRRFTKDVREFVVTRALLRKILTQYVDCSPADLSFQTNSNSKPILQGMPGLHFSVSHSRDLALLAVANSRVGIDVQFIKRGGMRQAVIDKFLSLSERSQLRRLPPNARSAALYRCWTRKEAVLKAVGVGLLYPARRLNLSLGSEDAQVVRVMGNNWLLRSVTVPKPYIATAALEQTQGECRWHQWKADATQADSSPLSRPLY